MADEKDQSTGASRISEPTQKKVIVDPFAKLTDKDWIDAMERGRKFSDAKDERTGTLIRRGMEKSITAAREELDKAALALRTYLERSDSDVEDQLRHRRLAEDLKKATDNLKYTTDEYVTHVSNRPEAQ